MKNVRFKFPAPGSSSALKAGRLRLAALAVLLLPALASCTTPVQDLYFTGSDASRTQVSHPGNFLSGVQDDTFLLGADVNPRNSGLGIAFDIAAYSAAGGAGFSIAFFGTVDGKEAELFARFRSAAVSVASTDASTDASIVEFRYFFGDKVPASGELRIQGFTVEGIAAAPLAIRQLDAADESLLYDSVSLAEGSGPSIRSGISASITAGSATELSMSFAGLAGARQPGHLVLTYVFEPAAPGLELGPGGEATSPSVSLRILPDGESGTAKAFDLRLHPGVHRIPLPAFMLDGGFPSALDITSSMQGFSLLKIETSPVHAGNRAQRTPNPIPAEINTILLNSKSSWRIPEFEIYEWVLAPKIFILDFRDRATQNAFFDRIAFYLEKAGFTGRLMSDAELAGRHGWNAHNYSPEGLAQFFNEVVRTNFAINTEEEWLRELALDLGLVRKAGDGSFQPGEGGLLSISNDRVETASNRLLLLSHEAFHGLFYTNEGLRRQADVEWANLSPESRDYLVSYFSILQYDTKDMGLMQNEFQAYMLQQTLQELRYTYGTQYRDRLVARFPERAAFFRAQAPRAAEEFRAAAARLQAIVYRDYGLVGGDLRSIMPRQ